MTLRSIDLQSDGDLDSIRNSCDVFIQGAPLTHSAMYDLFPNAHNIFSRVIGAYVILS